MLHTAIQQLKTLARRPGPLLATVEGRAGLDALSPVLESTEGKRRAVFLSPGLTDEENSRAFAALVRPFLPDDDPPPATWGSVMDAVADRAPMTIIIQGPRSLVAGNRRIWRTFGKSWTRVRRSGARLHLYFVDNQYGLADDLNGGDSPFRDPAAQLRAGPQPDPVEAVRIGPASHYDLGAAAPLWSGKDLLVAWALLGGIPSNWGPTPGSAPPIRAALGRFMPPGTMAGVTNSSAPDQLLQRYVQSPHRYASILRAIATGAESWKEVAAGIGATSSANSSSGPYLQRLRELGLIAVDRPLGARPGGRRSRYRLTDPSEAFWWSRYHPLRSGLATSLDPSAIWREQIQPRIPAHVTRVLPQILRAFLRRGAEAYLGSNAREVGPLWGEDFDFPAAATLKNGAVCYAHIHTGAGPAGTRALEALEEQMKEARYGFGRQARIRLLVCLSGFSEELKRESARNPLVRLLNARDLTSAPADFTDSDPPKPD